MLRRHNISDRKLKKLAKILTKDELLLFREYYEYGVPTEELVKKYNVSDKRLRDIVRVIKDKITRYTEYVKKRYKGIPAKVLNKLQDILPGKDFLLFTEYCEYNMPIDELAKKHNVTIYAIYSRIKSIKEKIKEYTSYDIMDYRVQDDEYNGSGLSISEDPTKQMKQRRNENIISELCSKLNPREEMIIKLYYGIDTENNDRYTLEEIGKKYNVSRERIRQIGNRALSKMKKYYSQMKKRNEV